MEFNICEKEFIHLFQTGQYKNNFSIKGLQNLFEFFENYPFKFFDVMAIACEFTEYKNKKEFLDEAKESFENWKKRTNNRADLEEAMEKYITENTILIKFGKTLDEGFIIQNF